MACNQFGGFMKLRRNKYLEKLGIKINSYGINFLKGLPYEKEYIKYEKKWGVNPAETFNLGITLIDWIYTHLKEYKKRAKKVIDLKSIKRECYDGKERTVDECIKYIIEKLARYIVVYDNIDMHSELGAAREDAKKALYILADIFEDLWW